MNNSDSIFSLKGKRALITGATGHLGAAMAFILAAAGAHVLINSRSKQRADSVAADLQMQGFSAESAVFDVTDVNAVKQFFDNYGDRHLHILINNAYAGGAGTIELANGEFYASSYDVSVVAAHNLLKASLPSLRRAVHGDKDASVINLASMYAMVSPDQRIYESDSGVNPPFYGAAKAALLQWTRYAACEFGVEGIRVNSISPGPFPAVSVQKDNPSFIEKLAEKVPLGRIGQASELQGPTLFLASSASSFVNGANVVVDGGWTCW